MKIIRLQVPATSANLGPGFDVLGVALSLFNDVHFSAQGWLSRPATALRVSVEGEGAQTLACDASNLVMHAAFHIFKKAQRWPAHLHARLVNRIPLSRGLGSSSAAIVGGMAAANRLLGDRFSQKEILDDATTMEGHPDNVTPALFGGFCISGIFGKETRHWIIPASATLKAIVAVPDRPLSTKAARLVLPKKVNLKDAVFTASHVAFLLGALLQKRYDWLGEAMDDVLHQPYRARLVPGLRDVMIKAKQAGAYGAALSGAGSCVLALAPKGRTELRVAAAMQREFIRHQMPNRILNLKLENKGVRFR